MNYSQNTLLAHGSEFTLVSVRYRLCSLDISLRSKLLVRHHSFFFLIKLSSRSCKRFNVLSLAQSCDLQVRPEPNFIYPPYLNKPGDRLAAYIPSQRPIPSVPLLPITLHRHSVQQPCVCKAIYPALARLSVNLTIEALRRGAAMGWSSADGCMRGRRWRKTLMPRCPR